MAQRRPNGMGFREQLDDIQGVVAEGLGGIQGMVNGAILRNIPNEAQIITSYAVNEVLFWLVTDVLEIAVGVTLKWDPTSISLAQIKKKIDDLQKDMNALLDADFEAAFQYIWYTTTALKNEEFESAYSELAKVKEYSIRAFSQMKTFRKKVFCKKMTIFSMHMIQCYNNDKKSFDHLLCLPVKKQKDLADRVKSDVDVICKEFEKFKEDPSWWSRKVKKVKSKKEEQDVLDGLLKVALPIIWHQNELFKEKNYQEKAMMKYLPDGKEDAAEILLEGKWPIRVWREVTENGPRLEFEFINKTSINEGIRNTSFHCIASNPNCKYFKSSFSNPVVSFIKHVFFFYFRQ